MDVRPTAIDGVIEVIPRRFRDDRGWFGEVVVNERLIKAGLPANFVQDNESFSQNAGTIRGLHYQLAPHAQTKLVRVLRGRILDVAVDIRRDSPTFGRHVAVELTANHGNQLIVPIGFAHAFCTLESDVHVAYKVSDRYEKTLERAIRWNDPAIGIEWPDWAALGVNGPTISDKDAASPTLAEQPDLF